MVCPFDRAQVLEQRQRDQPIPELRQALGGMTRCVPCQSLFEKGNR